MTDPADIPPAQQATPDLAVVPDAPTAHAKFTQLRRTAPTALSDPDPINPVPYVVAGVGLGLTVLALRRRRAGRGRRRG